MWWLTATLLALVDLGTTVLAGATAIGLRAGVLPSIMSIDAFAPVRAYSSLVPALLLVLLARLAFGLYPGYGLNAAEELRRQTLSSAFVVAAFALLALAFRFSEDYSRVVLTVIVAWLFVCLPILRATIKAWLVRAPWFGFRMLVVGDQEKTDAVVDTLRASPTLGIRPVPVGANIADRQHWPKANHVLLVPEALGEQSLPGVLDQLTWSFRHVWLVPKLLDLTSAWVTSHDLRGHLALELRNNLLLPWNGILKRASDLVATILLAPLVIVIMIVITGIIVSDSPGPPFYVHKRVGKGGKVFGVLKFRTMHVDAERRLAAHLASDSDAAVSWDAYRKLRSDPRVTRIGRWLRRTSLDELPQLLNVVAGRMSLVGPRAVTRDELRRYGGAKHLYTSVHPGLTGLWQVSGRNSLTYEQRVRLDTYYVRNWSVWLDLVILAQTPMAVLRQRGAY